MSRLRTVAIGAVLALQAAAVVASSVALERTRTRAAALIASLQEDRAGLAAALRADDEALGACIAVPRRRDRPQRVHWRAEAPR